MEYSAAEEVARRTIVGCGKSAGIAFVYIILSCCSVGMDWWR